MKRILVALLVIFCSLPCVSQTQKPIYVDGVNVYTKPKIYADSFDGFVNMRSLPSSKGNIVGKFRNGQVPGYAIKQEGNWIKIYYKGLTGYVYKKYTTSKPTIEVTVDVEGSWIEGLWGNNGYTVYMFFDNGTYEYRTDKWDTLIGTYRLAGNSIVLTPYRYEGRDHREEIGDGDHVVLYSDQLAGYWDPEALVIDVKNQTIGGMERSEFTDPPTPDDEYWDGCMVTREEFFGEKASVKAALGK